MLRLLRGARAGVALAAAPVRAFSAAAPAPKPRAVGSLAHAKRRRRLIGYTLASGTATFCCYYAYQHDFSSAAILRSVTDAWRNVMEQTPGDPNIEDLQKALGPPPPEGYVNVILAIESVLLRREWDRRYGWVYEPREGMRDLLKSLLDPNAGVYLTLWSENGTAVAGEVMEKLMHAISGPAAHTAPLGIEHMFIRDSGKRKEKRLEYFARDPRTVLLVDHDALSEVLNPNNTVLVTPMPKAAEAGAGAAAAAAPPDVTCAAIKALVARVREDVQLTGQVNVPRALVRLRADARADGFATDAAGLHAFLQKTVEAEADIERERRDAGLGGLLRRTAAASTALRAKATTVEVASRKPFRDPAWDTGDDSLLARKVRETAARALGGPPPS